MFLKSENRVHLDEVKAYIFVKGATTRFFEVDRPDNFFHKNWSMQGRM